MALPYGAGGWSAVCDCGFSDHTRLLFQLFRHVDGKNEKGILKKTYDSTCPIQ